MQDVNTILFSGFKAYSLIEANWLLFYFPNHFVALADVVEETMNRCRRLLLLYTNSSLGRAEGSSWLEEQAGLHRALLDNSLSVMLLEMEQLSDPSILPESLRILRDKQGTLQAWRKRRRWMCTSIEEGGEEDKTSLASFTLSPRFWRKVHYYMPVRGKAKRHSKRKLFLNLWIWTWLNFNSYCSWVPPRSRAQLWV